MAEGSFEHCQALLAKTDFFHMKSFRPTGARGTMSRSVCVIWNGQKHAVEEMLPARASPEFDELMSIFWTNIPNKTYSAPVTNISR